MARRRKGLSDDDRALWKRVAATTNPMHERRQPMPRDPVTTFDPQPQPNASGGFAPFRIGETATGALSVHVPSREIAEEVNGAPVRMDTGTHKKMIRGKLTPEARIDLHGMTLDQAHPRLVDFVMEASSAGKRLVLIITGKGRNRDAEGPIPERRGRLRHQVPLWLNTPPCNAVVLDIRTAHLRHGGEGAYYVYLKRRR